MGGFDYDIDDEFADVEACLKPTCVKGWFMLREQSSGGALRSFFQNFSKKIFGVRRFSLICKNRKIFHCQIK